MQTFGEYINEKSLIEYKNKNEEVFFNNFFKPNNKFMNQILGEIFVNREQPTGGWSINNIDKISPPRAISNGMVYGVHFKGAKASLNIHIFLVSGDKIFYDIGNEWDWDSRVELGNIKIPKTKNKQIGLSPKKGDVVFTKNDKEIYPTIIKIKDSVYTLEYNNRKYEVDISNFTPSKDKKNWELPNWTLV